eukprot:TRINITY_DN249_c0_g5_i1.p1 TRINITY_DN249_c0_g5~~TRINITY_DN249_c0_g5_i1.p1  ORF type:complete len:112 (-),score=14.89 TRINITY_DN249_c0_g5_i1:99-413(-)
MSHRREVLLLYKEILTLHQQKLPYVQRSLGDSYVKNEFKAHKDVTESAFIDNFMLEWKDYRNVLIEQPVVEGRDISKEDISNLSDEQKMQLEKLKEEAIKINKE